MRLEEKQIKDEAVCENFLSDKDSKETRNELKDSVSNEITRNQRMNLHQYFKAAVLAQITSILICGTGILNSELADSYKINIPTFQSVFNYALLMCVFLPIWLVRMNNKKKFIKTFKAKYWRYALLALTDVEANYFIVKAYSLTRVTTIQVIDAFVLPITVLLSFIFLKQVYKLNHFLGILSCLLGCALIIVADTLVKNDESKDQLIGDIFCLLSSILYATSNVSSEYFIKESSIIEYLSMLGIFGTIISSIQMAIFERNEIQSLIQLNNLHVWLLFSAESCCMFLIYLCIPFVLEFSSAAFLNVNLLTADFYTVLIGIFFKKYKLHGLYFLGYICILVGTVLYSVLKPKHRHERNQVETKCDVEMRF